MSQETIDLTIPLEGLNFQELLSDWRWIVPENFTPIQMTKFGDWFFVDPDGRVFLLDLIEAELTQVANSVQEYNSIKNTEDKKSEWFLEGFVLRSVTEGLRLKPGQCYGWRIHPIIGGKFEFSNIQAFDLSVYQTLMGQILRQWKQLKPGERIPPIKIIK